MLPRDVVKVDVEIVKPTFRARLTSSSFYSQTVHQRGNRQSLKEQAKSDGAKGHGHKFYSAGNSCRQAQRQSYRKRPTQAAPEDYVLPTAGNALSKAMDDGKESIDAHRPGDRHRQNCPKNQQPMLK